MAQLRQDSKRGRKIVPILLGAILLLAGGTSSGRAEEVEDRRYTILVDAKPAGAFQMTIRKFDDGTVGMAGRADIKFKYLIYNYVYAIECSEYWKDGRLLQLQSKTNDDGKKLNVAAKTENGVLKLKSTDLEISLTPDVWVSTYWRLPDARIRNQAINVIDADTGRPMRATLQFVGNEQLQVGGQPVACGHYRVGGEAKADLWFDANEQLIRQETIDDGHKVSWLLESTRKRLP